GTPVDVDLAPYLDPVPGAEGAARVFVAAAEADLIGGPAAMGRIGDHVIENERVRFVVEAPERVIGPCPYGGNLIDADVRRPAGEPGQDALGEICLFVNLAQTVAPDRYDILRDGSDGGAAVLAVTGHLELLDFVNVPGLLAGLGGGALSLGWDTETLQPLTVTTFYILRPGDQGVRVITALRNDGSEAVHNPIGHLIDSGGTVDFFNPFGPFGGFGYRGLSPEALSADPLVMLAFQSPESGHAYVPRPDPALNFAAPLGGSYVSVSGVAVSLLGNNNVLPTLLARPGVQANLPGILHVQPGATATYEHWYLAGGRDPAVMLGAAWRLLGAELGRVSGTLTGPDGPAAMHVTALDAEGHALIQARSGADGRYAMDVPAGTVRLRAWSPDRAPVEQVGVDIAAGGDATVDFAVGPASAIRVHIRRADGSPTPGKITVSCDGDCPNFPTAGDRDVTLDGPLGNTAASVFTGVDGEALIPLAPGTYKVAVTRGITWSVWPADAVTTGGEAIEVVAGAVNELDAEIEAVVDTAGALSADFHVHAINSPDSPVPNDERVRTFLGEGVDILVSTDHDFITDFAPTIQALGAGAWLGSMVGLELTTFDYGHYNGFPLVPDGSRNGGAYDWAGGPGPGKTPAEIFQWFRTVQPGDVVAQVNHPDGGFFSAVAADVLRGTSATDPTLFRLPATEPDPVTGDTGLWDEGFTAFEIYNGLSRGGFWTIMGYWLQMVGRGFHPTATAVSDTHKRLSSQAGTPRSFVALPAGADTIATFDPAAMARAVNAGRLIGTSGPFFRLEVRQGETSAGLGETLAAAPGEVIVRLDIQTPDWMALDTLRLYANVSEGIGIDQRKPDPDPIPATLTVPLDWAAAEREEVAPGHFRRRLVVDTVLPVEADAYVIAVLTGDDGPGMFPVIHNRGARPLGYSNPVFIDVDGGGYDHPPLADLARSQPKRARPAAGPKRLATEDDLRTLLEHIHLD
ncbi:MAG: CehA/McbA family metallohydrolase, partial [Myxococcales bacterium]|nr:CehA/McbA family metallohydrolase [Myxococcales bacterium]